MAKFREYFRRYRFLMYFYIPGLAIALWEMTGDVYQDGQAPTKESAQLNMNYTIEYSQIHRELYPERPRSDYFRGVDAMFFQKDNQAARKHFEKALATGIKTDEQLLYYYACTLVLLKEDDEKIDAAVRNWRINFPRSEYQDPRGPQQASTSALGRPSIRPFPVR